MVAKPTNAQITAQMNLFLIRQHAVSVALEVAKFSRGEDGLIGNTAGLPLQPRLRLSGCANERA